MKLKRLVTSISASFDDLVTKVENHEAVANAAIVDVRKNAARIRSQLNLINKRHQNLITQEQRLQEDGMRWQQRARETASLDKDKALRCVHALEQCEQQAQNLKQQIQETARLKLELNQHLQEVEQRLQDLQIKRDSLHARSARNRALSDMERLRVTEDTDDIFTRWEEKLITEEYHVSLPDATTYSDLETEFNEQEKNQKLNARLDEILGQTSSSEDK